MQGRNQRGVNSQLRSPEEGQSVRQDLYTPLIRWIRSLLHMRCGGGQKRRGDGHTSTHVQRRELENEEHTEELRTNPVEEVARSGGQRHSRHGSTLGAQHSAGDGASNVLCADAPPAKLLRAANRGDTLQVQILLVLVAEGVGHSPSFPRRGLETFHTDQLMCHSLNCHQSGWARGVFQRAMDECSRIRVVRTASLNPKPPRDNGIVATSWRSASTTTFRMLHMHVHNPAMWPSAKPRTISGLTALNI